MTISIKDRVKQLVDLRQRANLGFRERLKQFINDRGQVLNGEGMLISDVYTALVLCDPYLEEKSWKISKGLKNFQRLSENVTNREERMRGERIKMYERTRIWTNRFGNVYYREPPKSISDEEPGLTDYSEYTGVLDGAFLGLFISKMLKAKGMPKGLNSEVKIPHVIWTSSSFYIDLSRNQIWINSISFKRADRSYEFVQAYLSQHKSDVVSKKTDKNMRADMPTKDSGGRPGHPSWPTVINNLRVRVAEGAPNSKSELIRWCQQEFEKLGMENILCNSTIRKHLQKYEPEMYEQAHVSGGA